MTTEDYVWREHVVQRLRQRDRKECQNFKEIIVQSEICKITLAQHIYDCACDRSFVIADTQSFLLINIYCLLSNLPHADNRLIDHVAQLKSDNLKLSVENEQLRNPVSTGGTGSNVAIVTLEKKLLAQQEELTELHKRKGENSQMIVDLNLKVEQQKKIISEKEHRWLH